MKFLSKMIPAVAVATLPATLHAALIVEYGDHGPDDISMQTTVVGGAVPGQWAGGWSAANSGNYAKYESGSSLNYTTPGYTNDGTGGRFERTNNSPSHDRQFASALTGTIWLSGVAQAGRTDGRSETRFTLTGDNSLATAFGFLDNGVDGAATANRGYLSFGGNVTDTGTTVFDTSNHLLLTKVTLNYSGSLDRVQFWINPNVSTAATLGEAGLGAANLTLDNADGLGDSLTAAGFSMNQNTAVIDSLRIGTAGGDNGLNEVLTGVAFVPEPSSLVLFATGFAGLLFTRRRI